MLAQLLVIFVSVSSAAHFGLDNVDAEDEILFNYGAGGRVLMAEVDEDWVNTDSKRRLTENVGSAWVEPTGEGAFMVGDDRDEGGCIPSAGYTWCMHKNKCLRSWEEECEPEHHEEEHEEEHHEKEHHEEEMHEEEHHEEDHHEEHEMHHEEDHHEEEHHEEEPEEHHKEEHHEEEHHEEEHHEEEHHEVEMLGGQKDHGGCLTGAGYQWCESKSKCVKAWEEPCEELEIVMDLESFHFGSGSGSASGFGHGSH